MGRPKIGITLGDPGGIGPEIVLKTLAAGVAANRAEIVVYGSKGILEREAGILNLEFDPAAVIDIPSLQETISRGRPDKANGLASFRYFEKALEDARRGILQAVVTAPISKFSWSLAGISWNGHTHFLQQHYPEAIMAFFSKRLNVALYTHHIPLKAALDRIQEAPLTDFFLRLHRFLNPGRSPSYQFQVAGLNPHAGEEGLLGHEEQDAIAPAVAAASASGVPIQGPFPPDTVGRMVLDRPDRIMVALYHDQGLIAFKLLAFSDGVNITLGLPFVRTSPDHGTAFDIAGRGNADPESMISAVRLAERLLKP